MHRVREEKLISFVIKPRQPPTDSDLLETVMMLSGRYCPEAIRAVISLVILAIGNSTAPPFSIKVFSLPFFDT